MQGVHGEDFDGHKSTHRPRLDIVGSEALDSVTPWCKDFTFVQLLLNKKAGLGKTIGVVAEKTREAGRWLALEHAETIAQVCVNVAISFSTPDARREEPPSVSELLSNGLFRAVLAQCEGDFIQQHEVNEPTNTLLQIIKEDPMSIRKHLSKGKTSRECLDRAAAAVGPSPVGDAIREIAALADIFDVMRESKTTIDQADPGAPVENVQANMCRGCGKREIEKDGDTFRRIKMNKCSGCRQAHYCSKECQRKDWKEGGHKQVCLAIQKSFESTPGLRVSDNSKTMVTMKEMTFHFFQKHFFFVARRMWQVSRRAAETGKVPGSIEGGAERLRKSPRLKDFFIYLDYPEGKWSVHLIEGFYDKTDVPLFPDADGPARDRIFHGLVEEQLRGQHRKLLQTEASGGASGQFLSVVHAPTGSDIMCFIIGLQDQKTLASLTSDAMIREKGLDDDLSLFDEGHDKHTPNGGVLKMVSAGPAVTEEQIRELAESDEQNAMRELMEKVRRHSFVPP
jgi:hypothetical protein